MFLILCLVCSLVPLTFIGIALSLWDEYQHHAFLDAIDKERQ